MPLLISVQNNFRLIVLWSSNSCSTHVAESGNEKRAIALASCFAPGAATEKRENSSYASTRVVFGRPLGANQGVAFPIAQAHAQVAAASLMRLHAASRFDRSLPCGEQANTAKLLASQAAWAAANACVAAYGGAGFASEFDIERKFRETKLLEIAPVSNNLVLAHLAQRVLGLPRSY